MAYSQKAQAGRRCTAATRAGAPCRAYACWDDPIQRCASHTGRHHTGPLAPAPCPRLHRRRHYTPCVCVACGWPRRPGGGQCCWPESPLARCTTMPGTHRQTRWCAHRR